MITHPEKLMFPDDGITKGELAAYYEAVAPLPLSFFFYSEAHRVVILSEARRRRAKRRACPERSEGICFS